VSELEETVKIIKFEESPSTSTSQTGQNPSSYLKASPGSHVGALSTEESVINYNSKPSTQ
jgi:hypothetical protein